MQRRKPPNNNSQRWAVLAHPLHTMVSHFYFLRIRLSQEVINIIEGEVKQHLSVVSFSQLFAFLSLHDKAFTQSWKSPCKTEASYRPLVVEVDDVGCKVCNSKSMFLKNAEQCILDEVTDVAR